MNAVHFQDNYTVTHKNVNLYVDYFNNRLKVINYTTISKETIKEIIDFAKRENLGKIITNCRIEMLKPLRDIGFKVEGSIGNFFKGENAFCLSYFLDMNRAISPFKDKEDMILIKSINKKSKSHKVISNEFIIRNGEHKDIPEMIKLFAAVFKTYPTPVFREEYLKKAMNDNVLYKVVLQDDKIISVASADMDMINLNAEMTDCATYPEHRGKGLLSSLMQSLEGDLEEKGFYTLYSLSRSTNTGINMVLSSLNYKYRGRLINNCHICGNFEDMNLWVKDLKQENQL